MVCQFEINEILKNPSLDLKNIIGDSIYPSDDDTFHADDSIICSMMHSNYYELNQFISLPGSRPLHDKYSAIHMNIRSLSDKFIKHKPFLVRLEDSKIKFDFILFYETCLTATNLYLYNIAGYNLVGKNMKHMKADGVGIYVSDRYDYVVREDLSLFKEHIFESLVLEITNVRNIILIGDVYRVPNVNCQESIAKYDLLNKINDENVLSVGMVPTVTTTNQDNTYIGYVDR